jgi:hypothetical protein
MLQKQVNNSGQKNNDRNFIDPVHHPQIEVGFSGWIFFSEEIPEKFSYSAFLILYLLFVFHLIKLFAPALPKRRHS